MSEAPKVEPSLFTRGTSLLKGIFFVKSVSSVSRRRWVDYAFLGAFFLLILVAGTMSDVFFTERNISNILRQIVSNGLISLGMLVVILTGGIDLSVGSVVAFSAIVVSGMIQNQHLPLEFAEMLLKGRLDILEVRMELRLQGLARLCKRAGQFGLSR